MKSTNTREIAKSLGLSRATVSNVINGKGRVSDATRARVEAAITALGYVRDRNAVALRTGQSRLVGVMVTDIANPFYGTVISHIEAELSKAGYVTVLGQTKDDPGRQAQIIEELVGNGVAGLIVNPCAGTTLADMNTALARRIPVVLYVRDIEGSGLPLVALDDVAAGAMVAGHMVAVGYRRFAIIGGFRDTTSFERRVQGIKEVLIAEGCTMRVCPGPLTDTFGYDAISQLCDAGEGIDAVIAHNDLVALGCLRALRALDRVPGATVGLAGFDNLQIGGLCDPPLTTVDVDMDAIGREAGRRLVARLQQTVTEGDLPLIAPKLIIRGTTHRKK
ncbi:LacI family transcriptional regulator [Defluviimonas sp. WL0002]|uniref:LacI family transcriptional regulator n=1 Tax=Albidovulum marisflavi TaxID=2984159 RepID=A0ABT2ZDV3_9RHOB|nr:LacI family DNA-binding transcriptional regulator [Defluviimonas sp. WL0002]MCV2869299.1 LacI family transcriptional regulator [Defluviimonas sp. WL0002]